MNIKKATTAWNYLNGIVCIYKPASCSQKNIAGRLLTKLCEDLNKLKCRDLREFIKVEGDTSKPLSIKVEPNYADHPLVVGPRYVVKDFRWNFVNYLSPRTSGVSVLGLNDGSPFAWELKDSKPLKVYHIKGRFGILTDNLFIDGKTKFKCNYDFLTQDAIDRVTASMQTKHQRNLYNLTGVDIQSQEAYELAASGLVRPTMTDAPVVYSIKCIDFSLPEFTLEICTINENEDLFLKLIMEVGYYLKNVATTVTMRCVRVGFFTVEHALLKKHWSLENIIENMRNCRHVVEQSHKFDLKIQKITEAEFPKPISDVEIIEDDAVDMKT